MADNTVQNGTDTIATDEVATLNGAASSGVKVERVKVGFGADGDYTDASFGSPLPTSSWVWQTTSLTFTVTAGVTATSSSVQVNQAGGVTFFAQNSTAGSAWGGAPVLVFEQSLDATTWLPLSTTRTDTGQVSNTHTLGANAANTGVHFSADVEGALWVRVRCTTAPSTNNMDVLVRQTSTPLQPASTVIDRLDAGRVNVNATYTSTAPVVADTLLTLALNKGGTTSSVTTVPVTAGKTLRITAILVSLRATAATLPFGLVTLRVNYSGAAVIGSPVIAYVPVSGSAAVIGNTGFNQASMDRGYVDLTGDDQFGISFSNNVTTNVAHITVVGYEFVS